MSFDIEAQPLGAALNAFAARTGLQVVLFADVSRDITASKVEGTFSPDAALERLLARTGLAFEYINERTIAVRSTKPEAAERDATVRPESAGGALLLSQADTGAPQPAAGPARSEEGLDEILVTAQKRTESAIEVPISMTVLTAGEIEARRIQSTEDYILTIPNATFTRESDANPRVSLRGMSAGLDGGQFEPVAVTLDEISFGATNTGSILYSNAFDIERIEVLRGPQGTLSGSNSLGGTINIITAKPDPTAYEMKGTLDFSRFNTMLAKGVINTPITDTVAVRTAAYVEQSDGAIRNVGPAGGSSSTDNFGGRLALRWLASDRFTLDGSFSYEEQDRGLDTTIGLDRYFDGDSERQAAIDRITGLGGDFYAVDFVEDVGTNGGVVRYDVPESIDIKDWTATLRASYRMDRHTLDVLYGHHFWEIRSLTDGDNSEYATPEGGLVEIAPRDTTADSLELRVSSSYDGPLNWIAGINVVDEEFTGWGHFDRGDDRYAGTYGFDGIFAQYQSLESRAVFGNLFWDIGERTHLSIGGRASVVKTKYGFACCGDGPGIPLAPIELNEAELNEFNPRVALNYDLGPRLSAYAQFATGYRAGYGNPAPAVGQHDTSIGEFDVPAEVESEHVSNYEIGLKGRVFGGRLDFAAAVFHMDYEDLQAFGGEVLDIPGGEFFGFDVNAGSAYSRGAELETALRVTDGLQLRAAFGYVETHAEDLAGGLTDVDIPGVRPFTMTLSALYERSFIQGTRAQFRADYIGQSRAYSEFTEVSANELPKFGRLDLSAGLVKDRWAVMAYIENANDEIYWVGTSGGLGLHGIRAAIIPRTFGLRLTMSMRE
jgi:iron complex outermembrane receptor protein